jgi:hypothetical protein
VWCLVEIHAACQQEGMPIIMKAGSFDRKDYISAVGFKSNAKIY